MPSKRFTAELGIQPDEWPVYEHAFDLPLEEIERKNRLLFSARYQEG